MTRRQDRLLRTRSPQTSTGNPLPNRTRRTGRSLTLGLAGLVLGATAAAQETSVVPWAVSGAPAQGEKPSISGDGRYVVFASDADNLVSGDTNKHWDVFRFDRKLGTNELVSQATDGTQGNGGSGVNFHTGANVGDAYHAISDDGSVVAFVSLADSLVPGDLNGGPGITDGMDVFVRDLANGTTTRVSVSSAGVEADRPCSGVAISADGRYVSFQTDASTLVGGDNNGLGDVFVHDRQSGVTERVSITNTGLEANSQSGNTPVGIIIPYLRGFDLSGDGRHSAFESIASNLTPKDLNGGIKDVFLRDQTQGTTTLVSVSTSGEVGFDASYDPSVSMDGRFVAFTSDAFNLVSADTNGEADIFVRDLQLGTTTRVSVATSGLQSNRGSWNPSISDDGRWISFESLASNLVTGDTNNAMDVFLHDRLNGTTSRVSIDSFGVQSAVGGSHPLISADGSVVAFFSDAMDLVPGAGPRAAYAHVVPDGNCTVSKVCDGSPNSTGLGAGLSYSGTLSLIKNELSLVVWNGPSQGNLVAFGGAQMASLPFGDGVLCIQGPHVRLQTGSLAANGSSSLPLDLRPSAVGAHIAPGTPFYVQAWYQDPTGPQGTGFNLTDAIAVVFCP